jgi:hypothetical protein
MLSYQELPTSIQLWRGHGQEAKIGEAGGPRITRNLKRLGRFSSRVRPPGCPWSWCGATPRGQPWTPAVPRPQGGDGLSMRRMAVLWPVREPSLGRQVHRELLRNAWRDFALRIPATACHQRNYVGHTVGLERGDHRVPDADVGQGAQRSGSITPGGACSRRRSVRRPCPASPESGETRELA